MNKYEQEFYDLGIKEASEKRTIVMFNNSKEADNLLTEYLKGKELIKGFTFTKKVVKAFNDGVASEINRQIRLAIGV